MEWGKGTYSLSPPFLFAMKKIILFVLCSISAVHLFADGWQGQQGSRRFFLKTDYTVEGTTMTVPEYWIEQAPCDSLSLSGDSLFLRFNNGQLVMKGCLISSPSPRIKASVTLYQKEYRMDFVKADTLQPHYWPQNPVPPYPYIEEEIAVPVNDSIVLSGTLTRSAYPQACTGSDNTIGYRQARPRCLFLRPSAFCPNSRLSYPSRYGGITS